MKKLLFLLISFVAFTATAQVDTYRLQVQDFAKLKITDDINVEYYCSADSAGFAYYTCEPAMSSRLIFSNKKGTLTIQLDNGDQSLTGVPVIRVYSSQLQEVENQGDSTVVVQTNLPQSKFKARVVGNGTVLVRHIEATELDAGISTGNGHVVIVSGEVVRAKFSNVGKGTVEAGGLIAREVKVSSLGTGSIDCRPVQKLTIYGAGSGVVYYVGKPESVSNRSIGVKAVRVDGDN